MTLLRSVLIQVLYIIDLKTTCELLLQRLLLGQALFDLIRVDSQTLKVI